MLIVHTNNVHNKIYRVHRSLIQMVNYCDVLLTREMTIVLFGVEIIGGSRSHLSGYFWLFAPKILGWRQGHTISTLSF